MCFLANLAQCVLCLAAFSDSIAGVDLLTPCACHLQWLRVQGRYVYAHNCECYTCTCNYSIASSGHFGVQERVLQDRSSLV